MSELKENLNKLKKLKKGAKKLSKEIKKFGDKYSYLKDDPPINVTTNRNILFIQNSLLKIDNNIKDIEKLAQDKITNDKQEIIDKKFVSSYYLLETITNYHKDKDIDKFDYEVLSLEILKNSSSSYMKNDKYKKLFNRYEDSIVETFTSIKVKLVEGFNMNGVVKAIEGIGDAIMTIVDGLVEVAKFIGGLLTDFIMLFFELIKGLFVFITQILPKIVEATYNFTVSFFNKLYRVGSITLVVYPLLILGTTFYFQNILGLDPKTTSGFVYQFSLMTTVYLFWYSTESLEKFQKMLLNIIVNSLTKLKYPAMLILNKFENDPIFDLNTSEQDRLEAILAIIARDFPIIILRFMIYSVIFKLCANFLYKNLSFGNITLREIAMIPMIAFKDFLNLSGFKILLPPYNFNFEGFEEE